MVDNLNNDPVEEEAQIIEEEIVEEECPCGQDDFGCLECEDDIVDEECPCGQDDFGCLECEEEIVEEEEEETPVEIASDDISFEDFNTKGSESHIAGVGYVPYNPLPIPILDDTEERLEDKLAIKYPNLKFDTPMMSSGYMYDRLDVTAPDGEVFTWDMNTDYNAKQKKMTPDERKAFGHKKYVEFLKFANKYKFDEKGNYTDSKYRKTLGPDYKVMDDNGNEVEMEVTPGITKKALMLMEQDPTIVDMNAAINLAVQSDYGQMNIAWERNLQSNKAAENVQIMNTVKTLVREDGLNPNLPGGLFNPYSAEESSSSRQINNQLDDLYKVGMPREVVAQEVSWIQDGTAELKELAAMDPEQQNAWSDKSASLGFSIQAAQERLKENVRKWLAGSEEWGENKVGPLVQRAYDSEAQAMAARAEQKILDEKVDKVPLDENKVSELTDLIFNQETFIGTKDDARANAIDVIKDEIGEGIVTKETAEISEAILKAEYGGNEVVSNLITLRENIDKIQDPDEQAKARKEFLGFVQVFLDNDKVSLLRNPDGTFVDAVKQEQSEAAIARNKELKAQIGEALTVPKDELLKRVREVNTELSVLKSDLLKKGRSSIMGEASFLQNLGEIFNTEGSVKNDLKKFTEWEETGEMPLLLTPLPTTDVGFDEGDELGESSLIRRYNELLQYRSTLLLAQNFNVDPTTMASSDWGVMRMFESIGDATPEAIGMNRGLTQQKQREFGFDILEDVYGIRAQDLTEEQDAILHAKDNWRDAGESIPGLVRMGVEIYLTTMATGGIGLTPALLRAATFRALLKKGVSKQVAKNLATYSQGVATEYIGLQGSNFADRSLGLGPGIENPGLFALTASGIRLTGAQASRKFNTAVLNYANKAGNERFRSGMQYVYQMPITQSTEAGALKYTGSIIDRGVKSATRTGVYTGKQVVGAGTGALTINTAENVGAVLTGEKTMQQAFADITDPDHLYSLAGSLLFMRWARPDHYMDKTVKRFQTELDLIRGNNPQWNQLRRSLGMSTVSDKSEEYKEGEEAFGKRVDEALAKKIEKINQSKKPENQKQQEIKQLEFNANRLKLKPAVDKVAETLKNPETLGSYKEVEQAAYAISQGGFTAKNLLTLEGAAFSSGGTSPILMLEMYGMDAKQAQSVVNFSRSLRRDAIEDFGGNIRGKNFQDYANESINLNSLINRKNKLQEDYSKENTDISDASYEFRNNILDKQIEASQNKMGQSMQLSKIEIALKTGANIKELQESGLDVRDMNDVEMKKFMEESGGTFNPSGYGYQGVVDGKAIALVNTEAAKRDNRAGTETHEVWHHPFERKLGNEAIEARAKVIAKETRDIEGARKQAKQEALDYVKGFNKSLVDKGIFDIVFTEMTGRQGFLNELKNNPENIELGEMKEFLNEFIQLDKNGAFDNIKSEAQVKSSKKQEGKEITEAEFKEAMDNPAKFVDFVLSGRFKSKNINELLKKEQDLLGQETSSSALKASERAPVKIEAIKSVGKDGEVISAEKVEKQLGKVAGMAWNKYGSKVGGLSRRDYVNQAKAELYQPVKGGKKEGGYAQWIKNWDGTKQSFEKYTLQKGMLELQNLARDAFGVKSNEVRAKEKRLSDKVGKEGDREFDVVDEGAQAAVESAGESRSSAPVETDRQISAFESRQAKAKEKQIVDIFKGLTGVDLMNRSKKGLGGTPTEELTKVAELLFDLENGGKVTDLSKSSYPSVDLVNPTTGKKLTPAQIKKGAKGIIDSKDFVNIRDYFKDVNNLNRFLKTLPEYNVTGDRSRINDKGETIEVSGDVKGKGLRLTDRVYDYFYENFTNNPKQSGYDSKLLQTNPKGRSKGKSTQPYVKRLKPEFRGKISPEVIKKLREDLLLDTKVEDLIKVYDRTKHGQLIKGMAKLETMKVANEATRRGLPKDTDIAKKIVADLRAGTSDFQQSSRVFNKRLNDLGIKSIEQLLGTKDLIPRIQKGMFGDVLDVGGNFFYDGKRSKMIGSGVWASRSDVLKAFADKFPLVGQYETGVNNLTRKYERAKDDKGNLIYTKKQAKSKAEKEMKPTLEALEQGLTMEVSKFGKDIKEIIKSNPEKYNKFNEAQLKLMDKVVNAETAGKDANKKIENNKKDWKKLEEGKDLFLDIFRDAYKKDKQNLDIITYMLWHPNSNSHPLRNLASIVGKEIGKDIRYEEHMLPFSAASDLILQGITKSNKTWKDLKKWLHENYNQEIISNWPLTRNGEWSSRSILDHPTRKLDKQKNVIESWASKDKLHPELKRQLQEALEGKRDFDDVISTDIRKYNEYKSDRGYINPNKLTKFGISDARRYNVEVDKFLENNPNIVELQNHLIHQQLIGKMTAKEARKYLDDIIKVRGTKEADKAFKDTKKEVDGPKVMNTSERMTTNQLVEKANTLDEALKNARKIKKPIKKARVFDFDDTVARTNSKVFAEKAGERKILTAEEFAKLGEKLESEGWKMDFSDFNKVVDGKKGPLFEVMKKMKEAAGDRDMFILTARAQESAPAIHRFLKEMGIEIPLENIKGLGDSSPYAKSDWIVGKAAEGYNDFYFADDHGANVKAVRDALEVIDVKSQTQQARLNASERLNTRFNEIIEESTGIGKEKVFSDIKAEIRGQKARRQRFFIPPSAEDFTGLLYRTLGKGKKGEEAMQFYKESLLDPYTRAMENLSQDRVNLMQDFKTLKKELDVPKELRKKTESGFKREDAVRAYLWQKTGKEIPGISKTDLAELNKIMESDMKLQAFADQILTLTKGDGYSTPGKDWNAGTITTDLMQILNKGKRAKYLTEWKENVDVIFSTKNLNKLEAAYGKKYREALEHSLTRMKAGTNRTSSGNKLSNRVLDYVNNANGTIMFLNARSAVLQTISAANFTNWTFNNPLMMGKAFANQPQYWKDFTKLMNSDYLKDRRNGLKLNISESEIANAASTSKNKAKAVISYILEKGYLPTKFADSFAIASGGAMFYRNRVNDLIKKHGKSKVDAEKIAMEEFRQMSEKSQQSSDPMRISQQQSSDLGRIVLSFANTPMQYARIQKRAIQDIVKGRGSNKENVSKVIYYGFLQNVMFNALQQGLFALGMGDGEVGEEEEKKIFNTMSGMVDSQLRGLGMAGVTLQVLKNLGINIYDRSQKDRPEYSDAWQKLLEFSPSIKSKLSKFKGAAYPFDSKKRRQEVFDKGFSLDNPAYESMAKIISGVTNLPLDRLYSKVNNLQAAANEDTETWKAVAMVLGWPEWQLRTTADVNQAYRDDPSQWGVWEQKSILRQFGYSDDEIKKLKNTDGRVEVIKKLQEEKDKQIFPKDEDKKDFHAPSKKEKEENQNLPLSSKQKLTSMKKGEQVRHLTNYGLSKAEIRALRYEADRVAKLIELAGKTNAVDSLVIDTSLGL